MTTVPFQDTSENHVGTCGATVVAEIYEVVRGPDRKVVLGPDRRPKTVLVRRERHQCSRSAGECTKSDGTVMHLCAHGKGWRDAKSEPREANPA